MFLMLVAVDVFYKHFIDFIHFINKKNINKHKFTNHPFILLIISFTLLLKKGSVCIICKTLSLAKITVA